MNIKEIMTTRIVTVNMDDPLKVVKGIFDNAKFCHLLVVEAGKLRGVISDRDLLRCIGPRLGTVAETASDLADLNHRAHQIMSRNPSTLGSDATLEDAVELFNSRHISCIPVINEIGKPIGVVSWRDIIKTLAPPEEDEQD